ncbi:MAG: hypothetical protein MZV63_40785 [Marinilabiliales bacterium]|nr:hypothetical protein [Marinilabiliales bacterium]
MKEKMLLWSGITASLSPNKVEAAMAGVVTTIRKELGEKGVYQKGIRTNSALGFLIALNLRLNYSQDLISKPVFIFCCILHEKYIEGETMAERKFTQAVRARTLSTASAFT